MKHRSHIKNRQQGSVLLGAIISLAIFGIIFMTQTLSFQRNMAVIINVEKRGAKEDLKRHVRQLMSCDKTFESQGCSGSTDILNRNGKKVIKKGSGTNLGKYNLKAKCATQPNGAYHLQISYTSIKGTPDSGELFDEVPLMCPKKL